MSMPEQDDFFRRLGKKLDTELPFEQLPEEWANVSAQIPGKPARRKSIWWWLLFLLLLGSNLAWYASNQQLRYKLRETTEALVATQHINETNQPANASISKAGFITETPENQPGIHEGAPKRIKSTASNLGLKHQLLDPVQSTSDTSIVKNTPIQSNDSVLLTRNSTLKNLLFTIPSKQFFFKTNSSLYLVRVPYNAPAITVQKAMNRPGKWQLSPSVGYTFLKTDSLPSTRGTELGLNVARRLLGDFSVVLGVSHRSWQFGLDHPEPGLIDAKDSSCPYCPLDTILVARKQWSTNVSLMYEKEITKRLAVQLGIGWTYVPRFNQTVTYRYIPVYGGSNLTVTERNIPVPAHSLAHVRASFVFPANAKVAGFLGAQYDVPLKTGTVGWWSLQAGWRIAL
ncbi:MAG: hypothetical protein WCR52_05025 [Bacteroidota bacterium]